MHPPMTPLLLIVAGFFILGLLPVVNGIRHAPEGIEDASGFNLVWRNNSPEIRDVSCVWVSASTVPAVDLDEASASYGVA